MPASGEKSGLRTQKDLRPNSNDEINISIYQELIMLKAQELQIKHGYCKINWQSYK